MAVENYLECYHCPVAHKAFSALVDVDPDAYRLEAADGLLSQYGERRRPGDGSDAACQFHLVWPALKVIVYPGAANLSLGPVWPDGPPSARPASSTTSSGPTCPSRPSAS